jgi:hypothetical protein
MINTFMQLPWVHPLAQILRIQPVNGTGWQVIHREFRNLAHSLGDHWISASKIDHFHGLHLMFKPVIALGLSILLSSCAALQPASSLTAVVTGISNGRASVPNEMMYGLRTPGGRVYFVTQSLTQPAKEGDVVELELGNNGTARIREK